MMAEFQPKNIAYKLTTEFYLFVYIQVVFLDGIVNTTTKNYRKIG